MDELLDSERIDEIIEAIMKVSRGDYSVQIRLSDEYNYMDAIAVGFNMMVDDIKKSHEISLENQRINQLNAQLKEAKEKAEESDRLKTAFLQNMSHEIRTPMNGIMGFSSLLVKNFNNKPKLEKFSTIIQQRCYDLLEIIDDILDIAKIESGQLSVTTEEFDLHELFDELSFFFTEYQQRIGKTQIKFSLQTSDDSKTIMIADKVKLKQIFINLINNAFKFTDNGEIHFGYKAREKDKLVFYVSDTGLGIPTDKQGFVFERFTQLSQRGAKRLYEGTGLGLAIVKGLINLLGGEIWLESEVQKGSTFYFTVPLKIDESLTKEIISAEPIEEYDFKGKTILIVEDDISNSEYLKEILADTGVKIMHTIYGQEAIDLALSSSLDMVLMDINLPDIVGYEAIRQIKQHKPDLKIIVQTAYAAPEDKKKAIDAGCIGYVSKPIEHVKLLSMLNKIIKYL
jgi:signal transduction histidine kinase/CheY-like chemotaxis protein